MPLRLDDFASVLACVTCREPLTRGGGRFHCGRCGEDYPLRGGRLWAVAAATAAVYTHEADRSFESRLKRFVQKFPRLYLVLIYLFAPGGVPGGLAVRHALRRIPPEARYIVNLGSGTKRISDRVLNLDVLPLENVDVVADMAHLPFRDASLDMVISECALEHAPHAPQAVAEIARVVKPGGFIYVVVPFLFPYHEAPNDYYRWTRLGLRQQFALFEPLATGIWAGPMTTCIGYATSLFGLVFSFGSRRLATILTYSALVPLAPLKLLDPLFRLFPRMEDVSAALYFFGRRTRGQVARREDRSR